MSKTDKSKIAEKIRLINEINLVQLACDKRKAENAKKVARHSKFFNFGSNWYREGKELEDGLNNQELFKFETDDDYVSFKKGYNYDKFEALGYNYGVVATPYEELPQELLSFDINNQVENQRNDRFKSGYRRGLGFYYGFNKRLDEIPQEYQRDKTFLEGLKEGLEKANSLEKNDNKTK